MLDFTIFDRMQSAMLGSWVLFFPFSTTFKILSPGALFK